jgi:zinc metalloprotease ZmpB
MVAKKTPAKKTPAKKTPAKKAPAKKAPVKKAPAKKAVKAPAKKTPVARKAPASAKKAAPPKKAPAAPQQEFDSERNAYIDRDPDGFARQLIHTHAPVVIEAATAQAAAEDYLHQFREPLGLASEELRHLSSPPANTLERAPVQLRFVEEKRQFDTATVVYAQTDLGLPVWRVGVAIQMSVDPFRVLTTQSTIHPGLEVKRPSTKAVTAAQSIDEEQLAGLLGLNDQPKTTSSWDPETLEIESRGLVIYRYEAARRAPATSPADGGEQSLRSGRPTLPLPPLAEDIHDGQHYVCARIDFGLSRGSSVLHWVALIDVESQSVLYLEAFTSGVNGMVFEIDPVTTNGGPLPSASNAALNPVRVSSVLPGLNPPSGGTQSLIGENVQLSDVDLPTVAAPTEAAGTDFNFDARTNNFAAVNAYYHCDKFFRLLDGMGFTRTSFFGDTTFPTPIDHRGLEDDTPSSLTYCPSGQCVNARCDGGSGGKGIKQTIFALADTGDTTNPIGIANDYRVVLHELGGHGVLYNHIHSANFKFAHSAGDGVAAILNDPGSQATDRFVTFPWVNVNIGRWHDRTPAAGWGWASEVALNPFRTNPANSTDPNLPWDNGGYNNEQVLSTTHFRIYRSIGGDSAVLATQQFAARMTVYLIMRAIGSLSSLAPPADASAWETALEGADKGDWLTENVTGGCYKKVIRWSFEKQGLYQPSGTATPNNNEGAPPPIDVYIDDGRGGEYGYQPNWWSNQSVWNRLNPDGLLGHQEPAGTTNYAYVKIKNRGASIANDVTVRGYHCKPSAGLVWPNDLQPMTTAQLAAGTLQPNNAEEKIVGPFVWTPTTNASGHDSMLMIVSATGDNSNADTLTAGRTVENFRLVPNDNNIGQLNVVLVRLALVIADSGDVGNVCVGSSKDIVLYLSNSGFNPVTVTGITSSSGEFLVPNVLSYPLVIEPGNVLEAPIRFQPSSIGSKSAMISVLSNDPAGPRTVVVSGTAPAPRLTLVVPDNGDFGEVRLGRFTDRDLIINNRGSCQLSVTGIVSSASVFVTPHVASFPITVDGGDSITVPIRFQPTARGSANATLTIVSNDPASPAAVNVSGTGWPPLPIAGTALEGFRLNNSDSQHVFFIGTDQYVHELDIAAGGIWHDNDLTTLAGAVPPIPASDLAGYPLDDNSKHVFFVGTDHHAYELYFTAGEGWVFNDLTALARAVPPISTSALTGHQLGGNSKHVFFIGTDSHVHELFIASGGRWADNNLTTLATAVLPTPTSALTSYRLGNSQHVFFIGTDNHVHELFIDGGSWADNDLTVSANAGAGAVPPTPTSDLTGYPLGNSQHVFFIGTDNHVHELFIDGAGWVDNDLTALAGAGAVPPTPTSALTGYPLGNSQHVFFIGTDSHVHELDIDGGSWNDNDLTTLAGAVAPTPTSALTGYRLSDNSKHVFFIGTDDHVHELFIDGAGWVDNDLTALT